MDAGRISQTTGGSGFLGATLNGDRPGYHGEPGAIMSGGPHCLLAAQGLYTKDVQSVAAWTSSSILGRSITILSMFVLSVSRSCAIAFSRRRKTSPISTLP